jgi:primosomal protein N' (replication factor Y)
LKILKKVNIVSRLNERYQNAALPNYEIINLNNTKLEKQSWLSNKIIEKVNLHLEKKDQVLFFLNRRGFSPNVYAINVLQVFHVQIVVSI